MHEKFYSRLMIVGLEDKVKKFKKIEQCIDIEELCKKYPMVIECDGKYECRTMTYYALRYLYETEQYVMKSVNKMLKIRSKLLVEWSPANIRDDIMDIESDINYNIKFNKNKFKYESSELVKNKFKLFEVEVKEEIYGEIDGFATDTLGTKIKGVIGSNTVDIEFKDTKLNKYLIAIEVISSRILMGAMRKGEITARTKLGNGTIDKLNEYDRLIEEDILLTEEDNILNIKEISEEVTEKLDKLGILQLR